MMSSTTVLLDQNLFNISYNSLSEVEQTRMSYLRARSITRYYGGTSIQ